MPRFARIHVTGGLYHLISRFHDRNFFLDIEGQHNHRLPRCYATSEVRPPFSVIGEDIVETSPGVFEMNDGVGSFPVSYMTWYGAAEACEWEGKQLCHWEDWYEACSHGGEWHFPYGGSTGGQFSYDGYVADYIQNMCCTGGKGADAEVGVFIGCEGGYPGIFDMAGNMEEYGVGDEEGSWTVMGGDFKVNDGSSFTGAGCWFSGSSGIYVNSPPAFEYGGDARGFRCCLAP